MRTSLVIFAAALACAGAAPRPAELPLGDPAECRLEIEPAAGLDVAIVIDASRSTLRPSGIDVDQDGVIGDLLDAKSSDPLDSILAAEVAAVRTLLHAAAGSDVRFSIVSVSGRTLLRNGARPSPRIVRPQQARIRTGLTSNRAALERALGEVLGRGGEGRTDLAAGMNLAIRTLQDAPQARETRSRMVLFLADSPTPMVAALPSAAWPYRHTGGAVEIFDPQMKYEARRALRRNVRFHTFALGAAAGASPPHSLEQIAGATGGRFRAVEDPSRLHCALLAELGAPASPAR